MGGSLERSAAETLVTKDTKSAEPTLKEPYTQSFKMTPEQLQLLCAALARSQELSANILHILNPSSPNDPRATSPPELMKQQGLPTDSPATTNGPASDANVAPAPAETVESPVSASTASTTDALPLDTATDEVSSPGSPAGPLLSGDDAEDTGQSLPEAATDGITARLLAEYGTMSPTKTKKARKETDYDRAIKESAIDEIRQNTRWRNIAQNILKNGGYDRKIITSALNLLKNPPEGELDIPTDPTTVRQAVFDQLGFKNPLKSLKHKFNRATGRNKRLANETTGDKSAAPSKEISLETALSADALTDPEYVRGVQFLAEYLADEVGTSPLKTFEKDIRKLVSTHGKKIIQTDDQAEYPQMKTYYAQVRYDYINSLENIIKETLNSLFTHNSLFTRYTEIDTATGASTISPERAAAMVVLATLLSTKPSEKFGAVAVREQYRRDVEQENMLKAFNYEFYFDGIDIYDVLQNEAAEKDITANVSFIEQLIHGGSQTAPATGETWPIQDSSLSEDDDQYDSDSLTDTADDGPTDSLTDTADDGPTDSFSTTTLGNENDNDEDEESGLSKKELADAFSEEDGQKQKGVSLSNPDISSINTFNPAQSVVLPLVKQWYTDVYLPRQKEEAKSRYKYSGSSSKAFHQTENQAVLRPACQALLGAIRYFSTLKIRDDLRSQDYNSNSDNSLISRVTRAVNSRNFNNEDLKIWFAKFGEHVNESHLTSEDTAIAQFFQHFIEFFSKKLQQNSTTANSYFVGYDTPPGWSSTFLAEKWPPASTKEQSTSKPTQ